MRPYLYCYMLLSDFVSNYLLVLPTTALMVFLFFKLAKHVYLRAFALTNSNAWVLFPNSYMVSSLTFSGFCLIITLSTKTSLVVLFNVSTSFQDDSDLSHFSDFNFLLNIHHCIKYYRFYLFIFFVITSSH